MRALTESELWWKRLSHRVGEEAKLYVPETDDGRPLSGATWREECFRLWACRHRWRAPVDETDQDPDQDPDQDRLLPPRPRWKSAPSRCASACDLEAWASLARVRLRTNAPPPSSSRSTSASDSSRRAEVGATPPRRCARSWRDPAGAPRRASPWADAEIPETKPDVEPATAASQPSPSSSSSDEATKENPTTSIVSDKETVEADDDARRRFATLRMQTLRPTDATPPRVSA